MAQFLCDYRTTLLGVIKKHKEISLTFQAFCMKINPIGYNHDIIFMFC